MDKHFMTLALEEAQKAYALGEVPVGAVLVRDGEVIARAHNLRETQKDPLAHAELLAIQQAAKEGWRLKDCTLYVTLEPCPMCAGALLMAQIGRVVFGAFDEKQGCLGSRYHFLADPTFYHEAPAEGGLMEAECQALLKGFFEKQRRIDRSTD